MSKQHKSQLSHLPSVMEFCKMVQEESIGARRDENQAADRPRFVVIVTMRLTSRALAKVSPRTLKPLPPNLTVLPPIPLYRRLLRSHRKYLPPAARVIGDEYVKAEFRRTRDSDNPVHIIGFLTQWQVRFGFYQWLRIGILSAG